MRQTRHIHALRQNAIVEHHKLAIGILAPRSQRVKEYLTVDFGFVDVGTILAGDVKHIVTTVSKILKHRSLCYHAPDNLAGGCSNQNFLTSSIIEIVNDLQHSVAVTISSIRFSTSNRGLFVNLNRRRNDAARVNQFLSRYTVKNITKHQFVVHATTHRILRLTRGSSKEVASICHLRYHGSLRKELLAGSVVCLIEVGNVNIYTCLNNTIERVIGGEDNAGLTSSTSGVIKQRNLIRFGGAEVVRITTMNVKNVNVLGVNLLKIFFTQLVDQEQARADHNRRQTALGGVQTGDEVHDGNQGLAAACRAQQRTTGRSEHGIERCLLVGSQFHGEGFNAGIMAQKKWDVKQMTPHGGIKYTIY